MSAGRDLLTAAASHRWLLSGGLAAAAVATALPVLAPDPPATVAVLTASHDLAAGTALTDGDLRPVALPGGSVPDGAVRVAADAAGRVLAGAVRRGEPLTDVRLVGPGLLAALPPSSVAVPVRLADAGTAGLLHAGDVVDVLAAAGGALPVEPVPPVTADVVAARARVLAVPPSEGGPDGALVLLATSRPEAARLAAAAVSSRLSVVLQG